MKIKDKCICGNNSFTFDTVNHNYAKMIDNVLTIVDTDNMGLQGSIWCDECSHEYLPGDFQN